MGATFRLDLTVGQVDGLLSVVSYGLDDQSYYLGSNFARRDHGKEFPSVLREIAEEFSGCAEFLRQIPVRGCQEMAEDCSALADELSEEARAAETRREGWR